MEKVYSERVWSIEMEQLFDRLRFLIDNFAETQADFDRKVGLSNGKCNYWSRRFNQPRALSLMKVCLAFDVSANWLLLGEGPLLLKDCEVASHA